MLNPPEKTISSQLDDLSCGGSSPEEFAKMNFAVLLALVGLASCCAALIGGDRARDVTIKYSYLDQNGRVVEVEVEADRLGLQLAPLVQAPTPAPTPVAVRYVQAVAPAQPTPVLTKRLLQVAPAPVVAAPRFAPVAPVTQTRVVTRYVQVAAAPAPTPAPRYVKVDLDDDDDDDDEVRRVYRPARVVEPAVVSTRRASSLPATWRRTSDEDDSAED